MNYIYDIYVNFKNIPYDFFEWNSDDKIIHLKKIPVLKIDSNTFKLIYYNKIKIDSKTLNKIKNKTEIWKEKKKIEYSLLLCSNNDIIVLKLDKNGNSIEKSKLYIDEELEIIEALKNIKPKYIKIKLLEKKKENLYTRLELKKQKFIKKELKNISYDKLKYIYFECFNKYSIKQKMIINLNNIGQNKKMFDKLYNVLKLISTIQK